MVCSLHIKKKLASTLIVFYATTMLSAPPLPLVIVQRGDHYHFATYWSAENMVQLCSYFKHSHRDTCVLFSLGRPTFAKISHDRFQHAFQDRVVVIVAVVEYGMP